VPPNPSGNPSTHTGRITSIIFRRKAAHVAHHYGIRHALLLSACATSDTTNPDEPPFRWVGVAESVRWSPEGWPEALEADIHYPEQGGNGAGVLMVHGGGWEYPFPGGYE